MNVCVSVMLADTMPMPQASPAAIGNWLIVALFVLTFIDRAASILRSMRNTPEKREVAFAQEYASRTEFRALGQRVTASEQKLERELAEIRHEMKTDRDAILEAGEQRATKIHERINAVLSGVSRLEGRLDK